jgi:hypothetical protein
MRIPRIAERDKRCAMFDYRDDSGNPTEVTLNFFQTRKRKAR